MMSFKQCLEKGGKIKTKTFSKDRYQRICILDGKEYADKIQTKKK